MRFDLIRVAVRTIPCRFLVGRAVLARNRLQPPSELRRRISDAVNSLIDRELWDRQLLIQEIELASIHDFADRVKNLPQVDLNA